MSRLVTRRALGAGALTLALALPAASAAFADVPEGTEVTVFNVNDYHGRLSNAADLACTLVTEREQVGNDNHVFLSAGDNIGATEFASYLADDVPTIEVLNALGLAASADGNHEYDQGIDDLTGRVADIADFEYLSANVFHADGSRAATPYTVVDAGDVRVGVIGANTADTPALVSPSGIEGLEFTDPVSAVNDAVEELEASDLEYDLLVVEYHEGSASDAAPGENPGGGELFERIVSETSPEVDAIFNGHTHRSYNFEAAVPGTDRTRPIMQTGSYGENLGAVTLAQGADGSWEVTADGNRLIATENADIAACDAAADPAYVQARDIAAQAIADGEVAAAEPVGTITDDISTAFAPANASYIDGTWTKNDGYTGRGDDRASSSALSDELADSMRWATQRDSFSGSRADIGVMNPGGVRANLDYAASGDEGDGVVTFGEANDVVPFVNTLETVDLTGAQVKTMLEQQWQRDRAGNVPSRSYLQLGLSDNVTYTFDDSRDEGDRITSVMVDGEPLQADATYTIVSANFLTSGGDNFHVLADGTNRADTGLIDRDAWIDYLEANQDLDPTYAQRGVEVADQGIDSGTWNVQVSGVESRSLGAPQIETVEVTVGDETIEAPYENADGTWQATLAITCSEDATDAVISTTPDVGTAVTVRLPEDCEAGETPISFTDVRPNTMFYDEIMWMANQGYAQGWPDGTFRPVTSVNRDAMAAFLYRMAGSPEVRTPRNQPFTDVRPGQEHYDAIIWAHQEGITTGWTERNGTRTFRPTQTIDRDAMAAFVYRYAGSPEFAQPTQAPFRDVPANAKFAKEIAWAKEEGITTGWPNGTYRPKSPMNRDATAAFLYRMQEEQQITYLSESD